MSDETAKDDVPATPATPAEAVTPAEVPVETPEETPVEDKPKPEKELVNEVAEDAAVEGASAGVTLAAKSEEAMAVAAKAAAEAGDEEDEGEFFPSFFIDAEDRHKATVDCLFDKKTNRVTSVSRTGLGLDFDSFNYLSYSEEWFEFSVPDYEDVSKYRQRATVYRRDSGTPVVDGVQLRNFLLVWHLKDWSLRDRKGDKVELEHEDNGSLTNDSIKKVYSIPNAIIDVVLTIFERDVLLTD